ncbi:MAG TPA: hypothetical protein VNN10_16020 [Dehalococcoidia bacterium]|nr:hypothetical protein [Dehalococcoidia bacterium]
MSLTTDLYDPQDHHRFEPRATRLPITHRDDIEVELWVGGADSAIGDPVEEHHLEGAWLIDCAGDLPQRFKEAAAAWFPRVFADLEVVPSSFHRLERLAKDVAAAVLGEALDATELAGHAAPLRLMVMCKQGMNRSALMAGLILRELGASPSEIVEAIRAARPGALTNQTFVRLLLGEAEGNAAG